MTRDAHRAIPAPDAPTLAELGPADLARVSPHVPMPRLARVEKALGPFLEDQGAVIRRLP